LWGFFDRFPKFGGVIALRIGGLVSHTLFWPCAVTHHFDRTQIQLRTGK
jgi:hypothetical protein